jgi:hypothetical protein
VREVVLVVRARTRGDWQTSTTYGELSTPELVPSRFWVMVDLFPDTTNFYVVPEWWIRNDIYEKHQAYLNEHGGLRAVNDESDHHRIWTERVQQWLGRWEQLRIFDEE